MATFLNLPISIKVKIASLDGKLWYSLSQVDKRFSKYSTSKKGLLVARKIFGLQKNHLFGNLLTFDQLKDKVTYYAKYMSFYESNCFLLWCSDSFSTKKQTTGKCHDHKIPVIKRNGQLHLGFVEGDSQRELKVTNGVLDYWFVTVNESGEQHFFETRIPIVDKLPDIYRCYKIRKAPIGFVGHTQSWAFCSEDGKLLVNGDYTVSHQGFGSGGTLLEIGENCVYVNSTPECNRRPSAYSGAIRDHFISVKVKDAT